MTAPKEDGGLEIAELGGAIRAERHRQQISVQTLSQRSGVSFGLISQLERGLGNPSYLALSRIAAGLGLPLLHLLSGALHDTMVVRAGARHRIPAPPDLGAGPSAVRELLTPPLNSSLQLIRSVLPAGFSNRGRPFRHLGTEAVTVESGSLLVVHGAREITLAAGDTVTYGCSTLHWWANVDAGETVVLGAVTPFEV